ncbi:MAG: hypothetical protein JHD28_08680 [Bacteroidia bacterium]|nr:hypothetical protein [Bacteroidia bacterium]
MEFLKDFWQFIIEQKKWWLIPIILALFAFGLLITIGENSAVAVFIYPLF